MYNCIYNLYGQAKKRNDKMLTQQYQFVLKQL